MASRYRTTSLQLSGYKLLIRRIEEAMTRRDTRLFANPLRLHSTSFSVGAVIGALWIGLGLLLSFFSPQSARQNAEIVLTNSGGRYVMYDGKLHPVQNLASQRLIAGKPDKPKVIKDSEIEKVPRGKVMGILIAPDNFNVRTETTAQWTVCNRQSDASELSLTNTQSLRTTVYAGQGATNDNVKTLTSDRAVLVRLDNDPNRLWMVYKDFRVEIGLQDLATQAALGITPDMVDKAMHVSQALINTIPEAPLLTIPKIDKAHQVNEFLPDLQNGDVAVTVDAKGQRLYYAALTTGIQQVPELVAQLLANDGYKLVTSLDPQKVTSVKYTSAIDLSHYPTKAPNFVNPHVLCYSWNKGENAASANASILTGDADPISAADSAKVATQIPPINNTVFADFSYTAPGKGWLVQVTGTAPRSPEAGQLMWIDDTGTRYPLGADESSEGNYSYSKTVKMLGLDGHPPLPIPWSIASLYTEGATLSQKAALNWHDGITDNPRQQHVSDNNKQGGQ